MHARVKLQCSLLYVLLSLLCHVQILLLNERHVASFQSLSKWCDEKDAYLKTKEDIDSIDQAQHRTFGHELLGVPSYVMNCLAYHRVARLFLRFSCIVERFRRRTFWK